MFLGTLRCFPLRPWHESTSDTARSEKQLDAARMFRVLICDSDKSSIRNFGFFDGFTGYTPYIDASCMMPGVEAGGVVQWSKPGGSDTPFALLPTCG